MITDWILTRRMAIELERALRGGRVTDVGLLDDGRFALRFGGLRSKAKSEVTLAIEVFGTPPLATLAQEELNLAGDPGWARAAGTTLRGMRLGSVRARRGDRVLVLSFGTQSRFGVGTESSLILELIPRYGNAVVLKDRTIVAAAKQFSPAENPERSIQVGGTYEPPPLPQPRLDRDGFIEALAGDRAARMRGLGAFMPLLPRAISESIVIESEAIPWPTTDRLATWLVDRAEGVIGSTAGEPEGLGDVYAYRDASGTLVAAHVLPLAQFAALLLTRERELLPLLGAARDAKVARDVSGASDRRRRALATRIGKRLEGIEREYRAVVTKRDDAGGRDRLRASGETLYAYAHAIEPGTTSFTSPDDPELTIALDPELDAKANAAAIFTRYRKLSSALPHLERRLAQLDALRASLEDLAFELERAEPIDVGELAATLDELDGKVRAKATTLQAKKRRAPLHVDLPSGARAYVGRSPRENLDVTFRIARPDDLWFHARNIPSSHVVLVPAPSIELTDADLDAAAHLAAANSRARTSDRVEVDYTERKYVRKQRDAAPGMVWYTNARTRLGRPAEAATIAP